MGQTPSEPSQHSGYVLRSVGVARVGWGGVMIGISLALGMYNQWGLLGWDVRRFGGEMIRSRMRPSEVSWGEGLGGTREVGVGRR